MEKAFILSQTELTDIITETVSQVLEKTHAEQPKDEFGKYVFGIGGIAKLFNVSKTTAQTYKKTWLAPAVAKRGLKIICDVEKARKLFNENQWH